MEALRLNVLVELTQKADEQTAIDQLQLLSKSLSRYEGSNAKLYFETACCLSRVLGGKPKLLKVVSQLCEKADYLSKDILEKAMDALRP